MSKEHTLELNRLVVGRDEAEYEADGTIGEYLAKRAAFYANRLGNGGQKVKEFDIKHLDYFQGFQRSNKLS